MVVDLVDLVDVVVAVDNFRDIVLGMFFGIAKLKRLCDRKRIRVFFQFCLCTCVRVCTSHTGEYV